MRRGILLCPLILLAACSTQARLAGDANKAGTLSKIYRDDTIEIGYPQFWTYEEVENSLSPGTRQMLFHPQSEGGELLPQSIVLTSLMYDDDLKAFLKTGLCQNKLHACYSNPKTVKIKVSGKDGYRVLPAEAHPDSLMAVFRAGSMTFSLSFDGKAPRSKLAERKHTFEAMLKSIRIRPDLQSASSDSEE